MSTTEQLGRAERLNVIFVDDEQAILDGLQNRLRRMRKEWNMRFVAGGEAALEELTQNPANVLVTDMKMPGMDGAQLLTRVKAEHPRMLRVVLSGFSEKELLLQSTKLAHRSLKKPCELFELVDAVGLFESLRPTMETAEAGELQFCYSDLPLVPRAYGELCQLSESGSTDPDALAAVFERDMTLATNLLRLANSAFWSGPRNIIGVREAITYLGTEVVKAFLLTSELHAKLIKEGVPRQCLEVLSEHAQHVARLASEYAPDGQRTLALSGGLLHDIGQLAAWALLEKPNSRMEAGQLPSHAELGARLLSLWGLPAPLVELVRFHHQPSKMSAPSFSAVTAVHVADYMLSANPWPDVAIGAGLGLSSGPSNGSHAHCLDRKHLEELNLLGQLDGWSLSALRYLERSGVK